MALLLSLLAGPRFIGWLRTRGIGQTIRECGPESHATKQGTPTMGGVLILGAAAIPYLLLAHKTVPSLVVFVLSLIHISEPTRRTPISYAVFCLKKKNNKKK